MKSHEANLQLKNQVDSGQFKIGSEFNALKDRQNKKNLTVLIRAKQKKQSEYFS